MHIHTCMHRHIHACTRSHSDYKCMQRLSTLAAPVCILSVPTAMPILFACQKIQKAPAGSRRIIAVGAFFEVLYIPPEAPEPEAPEAPAKAEVLYIPPEAPEPEAPEAPAKAMAWPQRYPATGDYAYISERVEPDGSFTYPHHTGLTIPGPGDRMFAGLLPGQCACCYYRRREILEWTNSPGYLALMTPGWYHDHDGAWKWWHGECPHGKPGWSCRNYQNEADEENLENPRNLIEADEWGILELPVEPEGEAPAP